MADTPGHGVTLSNALRTATQLQFTVIGESNASYIIETSTNLQQWRGVASNRATFSMHDLVGTIYAPNADLEFNAGGSASYDFSGAVMAKSVIVTGLYKVHYDEDLARTGPLF
jgi:hypothetical protein